MKLPILLGLSFRVSRVLLTLALFDKDEARTLLVILRASTSVHAPGLGHQA